MTPEQNLRFEELASQLETTLQTDRQRLLHITHLREQGEDPAVCDDLFYYFKYPRIPEDGYKGARIDGYEIVELIGEGALSAVYLAREYASVASTQREVAIKLIHPREFNPQQKRAFIEEIRIYYEKLGNPPYTIPILSTGEYTRAANTFPFYVMPLIDNGVSVTQYAALHQLDELKRLALFLKILEAIGYAHARGITHGDIKSDNVLVDRDGSLFVIDFGLAKAHHRTDPTRPRGTPNYMAPEQVSDAAIEANSAAADIYSLGVLLYELLAGHKPYHVPGTSIEVVREAILGSSPKRLGVLNQNCRGPLEEVVARAMNKSPAARWTSVEEFRDALTAVVSKMHVGLRLLLLGRKGIVYLGVFSLCVSAFGHISYTPAVTTTGILLLRLVVNLAAIWLLTIFYHRYMKSLGPIWNSTLLFSMVAGITASLLSGLIYAFGPTAITDPVHALTPLWYVRLLRFVSTGIILSFFYGSVFALLSEKRNNSELRITEWLVGGWLALAGVLLITVYYTAQLTEIPLGYVLGRQLQGDVRYEVFVLHAGVVAFVMIAYDNWKSMRKKVRNGAVAITADAFCSRIMVTFVVLMVSGASLGSLFWGQGLTPDKNDISFAVFSVSLLSVWVFAAYFVLTGVGPLANWSERSIVARLPIHGRCARSISHLRTKWENAWFSK